MSWSVGDLTAGDHVLRTLTAHLDATGVTPGDHRFDIAAGVGYNGSLGAESDPTNN